MKSVIWKGESRVLPGYGLAVAGKHVLLPDEMAASYVAQDLAEYEAPPKKQQSTKED